MLMSRQQHEHASWTGARIPVRPAGAMRTANWKRRVEHIGSKPSLDVDGPLII